MASEATIQATPRTLHVGPFTYAISYDGEASYDYDYMGTTLFRSRRIRLDPRQSDTEAPQTFLHEAIHAIGNAWEIHAWERHTLDERQHVTDSIDLMASAMLMFLRANPEAVAWLVAQR